MKPLTSHTASAGMRPARPLFSLLGRLRLPLVGFAFVLFVLHAPRPALGQIHLDVYSARGSLACSGTPQTCTIAHAADITFEGGAVLTSGTTYGYGTMGDLDRPDSYPYYSDVVTVTFSRQVCGVRIYVTGDAGQTVSSGSQTIVLQDSGLALGGPPAATATATSPRPAAPPASPSRRPAGSGGSPSATSLTTSTSRRAPTPSRPRRPQCASR